MADASTATRSLVDQLVTVAGRLGVRAVADEPDRWMQQVGEVTSGRDVDALRQMVEHPVIVEHHREPMRRLLEALAATSTVAGAAARVLLPPARPAVQAEARAVPPSGPPVAPASTSPDRLTDPQEQSGPSGMPPPRAAPAVGPPTSQSEHAREAPRRWPLITAIIIGLAGIGVASWVAYANYQAGLAWAAQYEASEADNDALQAENDMLESDVDRTQQALDRSEADVAVMEARVAQVANEKARVEDEREQVIAMAERIAEVAGAYDVVASKFQACRIETRDFTQMMVDADYYFETYQWHLVSSQARRTDRACADAEASLAALRGYVDELLR